MIASTSGGRGLLYYSLYMGRSGELHYTHNIMQVENTTSKAGFQQSSMQCTPIQLEKQTNIIQVTVS